jgi:hypothetical protein
MKLVNRIRSCAVNKHLAEKVVHAVWQEQCGSPLKDFLTDAEIVEALYMLADILVCTGVPTGEPD